MPNKEKEEQNYYDEYYKNDVEDEISDFEENDTETENFQYNIDSYTNSIQVSRLIEDFEKGLIKIPDFQRPYVWNKRKRSTKRHSPSLFIDSILLGLPIPAMTIYKTPEAKDEGFLIDGKQRLMTMSFFKRNLFNDGNVFCLEGEGIRKDWKGKKYSDLDENLKERFNRAYIPTTFIRQITKDIPDEPGASSIYLLFDRLNSGGYSLLPHEKRGVLGINNKELLNLANNLYLLKGWKTVFPPSITDYIKYPANETLYKEYVFRTIAFANSYNTYSGNMQLFLDSFIQSYKLNAEDEKKHYNIMEKTISFLSENANNTTTIFKPNKIFNTSLFDAIFVGLYHVFKNNNSINKDIFIKCYNEFLNTKLYERQGKQSIANKQDVIKRISKSIEIFSGNR
jgi:hypothetical protein